MAIYQPQIVGGGGGAIYTAGTGINIDEENVISVVDPALVNGADAEGAIQLGNGENTDENTLKVANNNGNFELMSGDGTIPEARLADTTNATAGQVLTLNVDLNAEWQDPTGLVTSVNGATGDVVLGAADVNALSDSTKYASSLSLSIDSSTYVVTAQLKDQDGNNLGNAQTIDLPLESVVVSGSYDSQNKKIILTLQNGNTIDIPVGDLVSGLQTEITSQNKLSSDLVDDSNSSNKFVTASEKETWSGKQNALTAGTGIDISGDIISATGSFVPQYSSMPTATPQNEGNIVQYVGTSTGENTKGYFYMSSEIYSQSEATISQTIGNTLYNLSVDVSEFEQAEQPTQSGNTSFTAYVTISLNPTSFDNGAGCYITVDPALFYAKIQTEQPISDPSVVNYFFIGINGPSVGWGDAAGWLANDGTGEHRSENINDADWGITVTGTRPSGGNTFWAFMYFGEQSIEWKKNETVVDLDNYGITYSGIPNNGDVLTVSYTAPEKIGYSWVPINTQNQSTITIITED